MDRGQLSKVFDVLLAEAQGPNTLVADPVQWAQRLTAQIERAVDNPDTVLPHTQQDDNVVKFATKETQKPSCPQAARLSSAICGDPHCRSVHILLMDEEGNHMAQATVSWEMLQDMQTRAYEAALNYELVEHG